ncbi:magnesium transporter [Methanocella sp. CWC-04]|uniref:Magnesium transporter MgtE n=1 Tax=Methanooceanicella nereidis TaxID=2052831 RepID=A0AAP2W6J5_9EURY|nr:magnesium transporter [Methanocella sp. CWC-04]MCD1295408.1 magnesium transporter [Methanocella sp. CWC-04]
MIQEEFERLMEEKKWGELREFLNSLEWTDLKDLFSSMKSSDLVPAFRLLHKDDALELFESLEVDRQAELINLMSDPETIKLVESLDPDDRARLFEELPAKVTKQLLRNLSPEARESVNLLLGYPEGSAGRIMTSRYLSAKANRTAGQILSSLYATPLRPDEMQVIFVIDSGRFYKGYVTLGSLIKAKPDITMGELAEEPDVFVSTFDPRTEAAKIVNEYDLPAIAVVDSEGRMVGSVTFDDVLDVVEEEATEDFQKLGSVGVIKTSVKGASSWLLYQKRVPWLLFLVLMSIISGAEMSYFEGTIQEVVALLFFLPLLIGSGGNAGSQSATLMVRSLATGDVTIKDWLKLLTKEITVSLAIGITLAFAVVAIGLAKGGAEVALVAAFSMVMVVLLGSLIGMSLPFLLTRLNLDPATSSTPLVTSVADIVGVLIYLSIATWYFGI